MSAKANPLRVGIFAVLGAAILAAALFVFGIRSAFQRKYQAETYVVGDVEGLSKGSDVKLRGVVVGKVTEIGFSWKLYRDVPPRCVVVRFTIEQGVTPVGAGEDPEAVLNRAVADGFRAIIQAEGITGTSIVALQTIDPKQYPPLSVPWTPRYYYIPSGPSAFGQILASLNRTLSNLATLDLKKIGESADRALDSADAAFRKIGQLDTPGISRDIHGVAAKVGSALGEYEGLGQDARRTLQAMQLDKLGPDADVLVKNTDAELRVLLAKLSAIDIQALNDTLAGTRQAARNLNEAFEALRAHPSGFLFSGPPPPVSGRDKGDR
jgi:hypothetical protein